MAIIGTIIIGFIVGLIAKFLMPGKDPSGFLFTTIIGVAGAFIGSYMGQAFGMYAPGEPAGFLMSVVGALALLFLFNLVARKKTLE